MAYLSSIWAAANNSVKETNLRGLYKYTNDALDGAKLETGANPWAICVSLNKTDVYVVNQDDNTVSRYKNSERMKDIPTEGTTPYGVCEGIIADENGNYPIYVTNYATNTVSKIINDSVSEVIPVGSGPRGICVDKSGNIWIANYTSNDVSVIWKGTTIYEKTIKVATGPDGICSDSKGNVYVACSVSGVVSKISNQIKIADVNVGSSPRGICIDESDNVWVTNFNSRTVTKVNGADLSTQDFPVGSGPLSIGLRRILSGSKDNSDIVVYNYTDKTIARLDVSTGAQIGEIETGFNPMGFGDFTGMQTYLMKNAFDGQNPGGTTPIQWEDLSKDLQDIILGVVAPNLTYKAADVILANHTDYPTVQAALDHLLYEAPELGSFAITSPANATAEIGSTVKEVKFAWKVTNPTSVQAQNITCASNSAATVGAITPGILTATLDDKDGKAKITSNTTWTLTIRDQAGTATKEATLKFLPKMYYGVSKTTVVKSADIIALSDSEFIEGDANGDMSKVMKFNATGGKYLIFAVPSAFRMNAGGDITIGGFINSDWNVQQDFKLTNASGYANKYDVYILKNIQTDENIEVTIKYGTGNSNSTDLPNSAGANTKDN